MNVPNPEPTSSLQLRRLIAAPRERVFRAWIERESLPKWFRPGGVELTVNHLDATVGGTFQFETQSSDGTRTLTTGTYLEINYPEKLVFTWLSSADQKQATVVTIQFIEQGMMTEIILTHDRFAPGTRTEVYAAGWMSILDQLAHFTLWLT